MTCRQKREAGRRGHIYSQAGESIYSHWVSASYYFMAGRDALWRQGDKTREEKDKERRQEEGERWRRREIDSEGDDDQMAKEREREGKGINEEK